MAKVNLRELLSCLEIPHHVACIGRPSAKRTALLKALAVEFILSGRPFTFIDPSGSVVADLRQGLAQKGVDYIFAQPKGNVVLPELVDETGFFEEILEDGKPMLVDLSRCQHIQNYGMFYARGIQQACVNLGAELAPPYSLIVDQYHLFDDPSASGRFFRGNRKFNVSAIVAFDSLDLLPPETADVILNNCDTKIVFYMAQSQDLEKMHIDGPIQDEYMVLQR